MRILVVALFCLSFAVSAFAASPGPRDGWVNMPTTKAYQQLVDDVKSAARANKMGVVTEAGPTGAAASRGVAIPGNRVIGVFNNVFAVTILGLSPAAMIEAPIRFYVTENDDGTATLSYKTPSYVFAPYVEEAGQALADEAAKLDAIFLTIAETAAK